jgi:site-specific DNA recombinase
MSLRAALYARVSTARQEQEKTVASQIDAMEQAASAMGLTVPSERRYVDDGVSGSRLARPGLDALRDAAADGLLDVVFVYCPDRLARNYVHQHVLIEELQRRGVELHFVEHPIGERAEDRLLLEMQGVIAEYERAKIIERTRRGRLHKIRTGQSSPFGPEPPYGYASVQAADGSRRIIVVNDVEAQNVRAMFRWVLDEGLSCRGVAIRLNTKGVPPRRARKWNTSVVYGILTNPAYGGHAAWGRIESAEPKRPRVPDAQRKRWKSSRRTNPREQWLSVPVPPIVEESSPQRVCEALAKNRVSSPRNVQHEYLLRTLVVCGQCGRRMAAGHQRRRGYEYFFYECKSYNDVIYKGDPRKCTAPRIRREELDGVVWDAVVTWIRSPTMLQKEVEAWRTSRDGAAQRTRDFIRLEKTARQLQTQVDRLVDAYQAGAIKVEELQARRERLEAEKEATQARRQELETQEMARVRLDRLGDDLSTFAATLRAGLDKLDFQGRQRLIRLLLERVVVTGDHVAIEHAIPLSGRFAGLRPREVRHAAIRQHRQALQAERRTRRSGTTA